MQFTVPRLIKDKRQYFSILFYAQAVSSGYLRNLEVLMLKVEDMPTLQS